MGVAKRPDGSWRARIYGTDGKQHAKHFTTKRDAVRWEAEQLAARSRGVWVDPNEKMTVIEYARQWAAARPYRVTTARTVGSLIENHIAGTSIGNRKLIALRPSEVQAWATDRSKLMSPLRLRNLVGLLKQMYRDAVIDRLVGVSPVVRIDTPRSDQELIVPLTVDEVKRLAEAIPERNQAMVITQATCGIRLGELLALRVQDVDFLRRTLRVEFQFAPQSKIRSEPKTPRSRRTIPLPSVTAEALAEHIAKFPPTEDGTLFSTRLGTPYRHDYFGSQIFKKAVIKAGLADDVTTHDLRHHYASELLAAGESVVVVARRLGHNNATTVLKVYGHLVANQDDRTRQAIDRLWGTTPEVAKVVVGRQRRDFIGTDDH